MTNVIKNNIPNTVTCLNLFSGCIACVMAFEARYDLALLFIVLSAVFDFFDGAPSLIVFSLFKEMYYPANMEFLAPYLPYAAFLISVFSALRLAKFNNDTRQTSSFVGLPVPANALFWGSFVVGAHDFLVSENCHPVYLILLVCLFSWLLVSEIPMFSLKVKSLAWKGNELRYILIACAIIFVALWGFLGISGTILLYIVLSIFNKKG